MPHISAPSITAPDASSPPSVGALQRAVVAALQRLVQQINGTPFTSEPATDVLDMGNHRITGVVDPSNSSDVVTLSYLRRAFRGGQSPTPGGGKRGGGGPEHLEACFTTPGAIQTGITIAPAYNVGIDRDGQIIEVNIGALEASVGGDVTCNILVVNTATTTVLATDIALPAGQTSVVRVPANNVPVAVGDQLVLSCTGAGLTMPGALVTVGVVIKRSNP